MANNFCRFLSNGYRFRSDGYNLIYSPCCWFKDEVNVMTAQNFVAEQERISKITDWTQACRTCKQIEDSGVYGENSPRLRSFKEILDSNAPDNVPVWIELTIDITCNAACIMCGSYHSTTWIKQDIKFGLKRAEDLPDIVDPVKWLEKIESVTTLNYVKSISFLGGEPLQSPIPLIFLQKLKNIHGTLNDVVVHIQTNGSIIPDPELVVLLRECKIVRFNMSIDGVGKRFEYVRYPLLWHRIENTINHIRSLQMDNVRFIVLATLNQLNAYYYDELEQWTADLGLDNLFPNRSSGKVDLNFTPPALRTKIVEKFGADHPVSKMFSNLEVSNNLNKGLEFIEFLDAKRNTDWRKTFPEIVKYFE